MKISAYHKSLGHIVKWWNKRERFDIVYSSKIFDFTPINPDLPETAIKGGSGYDIHSVLPPEIEAMYPDYSIYSDCDYAIGYITRGCPNHCRWCIVPDKEGGIKPYRTWQELVRSDSRMGVEFKFNLCNTETTDDRQLAQMTVFCNDKKYSHNVDLYNIMRDVFENTSDL